MAIVGLQLAGFRQAVARVQRRINSEVIIVVYDARCHLVRSQEGFLNAQSGRNTEIADRPTVCRVNGVNGRVIEKAIRTI